MKEHIRKYYDRLYQGKKGAEVRGFSGKSLAMELGYPGRIVNSLPEEIWEDFLPCGNPLSYIDPKPGDTVLNLGCGAGVDSVVLKFSTGSELKIVNLDTSAVALKKLAGLAGRVFPGPDFDFVCADAESLPFRQGSFEWIIINGVFNLFPAKNSLIVEIYRVLKPGGTVAGADLCRRGILPDYFASEPDAWAWCMSGALSQAELSEAFETGGFTKLELVTENLEEHFDRATFAFGKIRN